MHYPGRSALFRVFTNLAKKCLSSRKMYSNYFFLEQPLGEEAFDFDLRTKSAVDATRTKMRRFFELTADGKADLERHFGGHSISGRGESGGVSTMVAEIVKRLEDKDFQVRKTIQSFPSHHAERFFGKVLWSSPALLGQ